MNEIYVCLGCKRRKLKQLNIQMKIGSIPCRYGVCDVCKVHHDELYSYSEEKKTEG
jgi:hypothetical protein